MAERKRKRKRIYLGNHRHELRASRNNRNTKIMNAAKDHDEIREKYSRNGKLPQAYKIKAILDHCEKNGKEPIVEFGSYGKPKFVRDPRITKRICKFLKLGYNYTTICRYVGIRTETFKEWLRLGRAGAHPVYVEFYRKIQKADAQAEVEILNKLKDHQKHDWRASAWHLERRWPEHWAKRTEVSSEVQVKGEVIHKHDLGKRISSDKVARELARKMLDGDEFGYHEIEDHSSDPADTRT